MESLESNLERRWKTKSCEEEEVCPMLMRDGIHGVLCVDHWRRRGFDQVGHERAPNANPSQ
jgi:hypothetical protein